MLKKNIFYLILLSILFLFNYPNHAAPAMGILQTVTQPDGTSLEVKVFGDEFYNWKESLDGYTLIQDPNTGVWSYAILNADASELISSGIPYPQTENASKTVRATSKSPLEKGIRLPAEIIQKKVQQRKAPFEKLLLERRKSENTSNGPNTKSPKLQADESPEVFKALTILIDFPDRPASVPPEAIDDLFNEEGYTTFGNNGSIRDFYLDVSQGAFHLDTTVANHYYRAPLKSSAYANTIDFTNLHNLIKDALIDLDNRGFDFTTLTTRTIGTQEYVKAVNVIYAGANIYSGTLWPHWYGITDLTLDGVSFDDYQLSGSGDTLNPPSIGVIAHELGHMLFYWPDTYDTYYNSKGTGIYDLMGYGSHAGNGRNPIPPNPYYRNVKAGWGTITELTPSSEEQFITVSSTPYNTHRYQTPLWQEFFLIENIQNTNSRYSTLSQNGLLIWHIDSYFGWNDNYQMLPESHYSVSVEQADGRFDLEKNGNFGDITDFFYEGNNTSFGYNTNPSSKMWNTTNSWQKPLDYDDSGFQITNISAPGPNMTFTLSPYILYYNLTFDKNGGDTEASPKNLVLPFPKTLTLPDPPTREGYDFVEWRTQANGLGERVNAGMKINKNQTFYAKWTPSTYTITYHPNGSDEFDKIVRTYLHNEKTYYRDFYDNATRTNYYFKGWNTQPDGRGMDKPSVLMVTSNYDFYAQWKIRTGVVFLVPNGGDFKETRISGDYTSSIELPTNLTRQGFQFVEWNTEKDGSGETLPNTYTIVSSAIRAYAIWEKATHKITFEPNGAANFSLSEETYADKSIFQSPSPTPEKSGFVFKGWNTRSDGNGTFYIHNKTRITSSLTLYAIFESAVQSDPLLLTSSNPKNKQKNVDSNATIELNFNHPVEASKTFQKIKLLNRTTKTNAAYEATISGNQLQVKATQPLDLKATYQLIIPKNAISDRDGNVNNTIKIMFKTKKK